MNEWTGDYVRLTGDSKGYKITGNNSDTLTIDGKWTTNPGKGTPYTIGYSPGLDYRAIIVIRSTDAGKTFSWLAQLDSGDATGATAKFVDQPSIAVGPASPDNTTQGSVWVSWRGSNQHIDAVGALVKGKGATDVGTFSGQQSVDGDSPENSHFRTDIQVGPQGQVVVSYMSDYGAGPTAATIFTRTDPDGLKTDKSFGSEITVGSVNVGTQAAQNKLKAQPNLGAENFGRLAWDRSGKFGKDKTNGRLYLVTTDAPTIGGADDAVRNKDTNIVLYYSDDSGATWTRVKGTINDDGGKTSQFLPSIAVDQTTGFVAITWYDARDDAKNNTKVKVYGTVSDDGGQHFEKNLAISKGTSDATLASAAQTGKITDATKTTIVDSTQKWAKDYWKNLDVEIVYSDGTLTFNEVANNTGDTLVLKKEIDPVKAKGGTYLIRQTKSDKLYGFDFGDYAGLAFQGGNFYPIWSDNSNSTSDNPDGTNRSLDIYTNKVKVTQKTSAEGTLQASATSSVYGSAVTFTAAVSGSGGPPTGSVTFYDGNTAIGTSTLDGSGTATLTTSSLTPGNHSVTAVYNGDATFAGTTSGSVTETVLYNTQADVLYVSQTGSSSPVGNLPGTTVSTYINAQISTPFSSGIGRVDVALTYDSSRFSVADVQLGSLLSNAGFSLSVNTSTPGVILITAQSPTGTAQLSPGTVATLLQIDFTVLSSANAGTSPLNLLASYTSGQGTVFTDLIDTTGASLPLQPSPTNQAGDPVDGSLTVTAALSQTTLSSSVSSPNVGDSITFTATVSTPASGTPTGSVTFYDGSNALGTVTLGSNGQASLTTTSLDREGHEITAVYNGDSNFGASSSSILTQSVYQPPTVSALSSSTDTASGGTVISIIGSNFTGATSVSFGSVPASSFTVLADGEITVTVPAQVTTGTVHVTVTTPDGTSATTSADLFTYSPANTVTWVGGSSGSWGTASNWSSGALPGAGDDVVIVPGVTVTISGGANSVHSLNSQGSLILSSGSLAVAANSTVSALTISSGTLSINSVLTVPGTMNWSGGTLSGPGTTLIASGATLTLNSSQNTLSLQGGTLSNAGSIVYASTGTGTLDLGNGAVLDNTATGQFNDQVDTTLTSLDGTGVFSNEGSFTKSGGTGTTEFGTGLFFDNNGVVQILSGTLRISGGGLSEGSVSVASGTTLDLNGGSYTLADSSLIGGDGAVVLEGGAVTLGGSVDVTAGVAIHSTAVVSGSGTVYGSVTNSGTLNVVGADGSAALSIAGDYTQTSTGILGVVINGTAPGSQFSQLSVSGNATLNGSLAISVGSSYVHSSGDTFPLITFGSDSGSFSTITGLNQGTYSFTPQYDSNDFSLVAKVDSGVLEEFRNPDILGESMPAAVSASGVSRDQIVSISESSQPLDGVWMERDDLPSSPNSDGPVGDLVFLALGGSDLDADGVEAYGALAASLGDAGGDSAEA
jgi:hypothetical protein